MSDLFESRLIREYPEFYCGLGLWAVALLVVIGAAMGLVPIRRQRTAVAATLVAVGAPLVAIVLAPGLIAVELMAAAVPSAIVAFGAGFMASRRLQSATPPSEARGQDRRHFLALGLLVAALVGALIYALATMTIRF